MSTTTPNIGLFKYDVTNDATTAFSITNALNNNWDKLDTAIATSSGVTTTISDNTWLREWNDGWKEMGGIIPLSEQWLDWTQPSLSSTTSYGTISCGSYYGTASNSKWWCGYNANNNPTSYYDQHLGANGQTTNYVNWQLPVTLKISRIRMYSYYNSQYAGATKTVEIYTDSNKSVQLGYGNFTGTVQQYIDIYCDDTKETNCIYFNYPNAQGGYTPCVYRTQIIAKYKVYGASSITFPVSFSNTDYSYALAFQGGQATGYVNTKSTTGMTLTNTSASNCNWIACGY